MFECIENIHLCGIIINTNTRMDTDSFLLPAKNPKFQINDFDIKPTD